MTELVFLVEEDPEGGYSARGVGESIFTQADDLSSLRDQILDAIQCHFPDQADQPKMVRLP